MESNPSPTQEAPSQKHAAHLSKDGKWRSFARVPHLLQYVGSGVYYARTQVRGKIIRKSLETTVFSSAKLRLVDFLKERHQRRDVGQTPLFSEALELYLARVKADHSIKDGSKVYRQTCADKIQKTWPELSSLRLGEISHEMCRDWANRLRPAVGPQYFNNLIDTFRLVLEEGIQEHERRGGEAPKNAAQGLTRAKIRPRILKLPEKSQFAALIKQARAQSVWGERAADLLEFLAYSGMRLVSEASLVTWGDVDWTHNEIIVRGRPDTRTKNGEIRRIPILPDMRDLLKRLQASQAQPPQPTDRVMQIIKCPSSLDRACKEVGIPHLRHHDFRHIFATRCIEAGVDVPTVSRWLGHKDGGGLAMRTYGHLCNDHSQQMAGKVKF